MIISKRFTFEASHILPNHPGKCGRLHGHSYKVTVFVEGPVNTHTGFVRDYAELKAASQPVIDLLDHHHLNCFIRYPSAENIATFIAHQIYSTGAMNDGIERLSVTVQETENTSAQWDSKNLEDIKRFEDPLDAPWRAPDPGPCSNVPATIASLEESVPQYMRMTLECLMKLEQYKLYCNSMGAPGAVFDEINAAVQAGVIGEKEKAE